VFGAAGHSLARGRSDKAARRGGRRRGTQLAERRLASQEVFVSDGVPLHRALAFRAVAGLGGIRPIRNADRETNAPWPELPVL
jgi:hypothetical protein